MWRLTHGDQDALVIGKISDQGVSKYTVEVIHVISGKLNKKTIKIHSDFKYSFLDIKPSIEDFCVLSLDKGILGYEIKWGVYKVSSDDYKTLKFVKTALSDGIKADLTAFEYYINSNGKDNDFYFEGNTAYLRQKNGKSIVIYPVKDKEDKDISVNEDEENNLVNLEETSQPLSQNGQNIVYIYVSTFIVVLVGIIFVVLRRGNVRKK